MDHKEFLKSLSSDDRAYLTKKSDLAGVLQLSIHWGLIFLCTALIGFGAPGWQVLMLLQGILLVFLFTLLHETSHQTPFETSELNTVVGSICGVLIVLPSKWFTYFHLAHHRYTHDPKKDPELATPRPETLKQYIWYISGLPMWYYHIKTLCLNASGLCTDEYVPVVKRSLVTQEARFMIAIYGVLALASIWMSSTLLLWIWVVPLLLGQPFLRIYLMAEHGRCPHVSNMFENTRTIFTSWIVRRLAWNMPYHAEHHALPTVPFYRLPALHKLTARHLRETEKGYTRFHSKYVSELRR